MSMPFKYQLEFLVLVFRLMRHMLQCKIDIFKKHATDCVYYVGTIKLSLLSLCSED